MPADFHLAPPAKTVDGLFAVPIDIGTVDAVFTFDGAAETASADATITYTVGPESGCPFFDLRQEITAAWLDGLPFPAAQLAHHAFGSGSFTDLRVIESVQAAGSVHTLRVQYTLRMPDSQMNPYGYSPALEWAAGPKLKFVFGLSDLNRARYAEAWLPANLLFDQYTIELEIRITGTMAGHSVITNGSVTTLGTNHWKIGFPSHFSALSPLLEIRAADTLIQQNGTALLPVSGKTVTIECWKPVSSAIDLTSQINIIRNLLTTYENAYGPYMHDDRFVVFFNGGGMEYEGGTTTATGIALSHETFHSWFARGVKPSSQADGWWDEGLAMFNDDGANDAVPLDFANSPVILCSRDPWQRHTLSNAYSDGNTFWKGIASILVLGNFKALLKDLYTKEKGNPVSTRKIEEYLVCRTGNTQIVDAFHRFVYGFPDSVPAPDLWFRDNPGDSGADGSADSFWDSPDLWVRNHDDGGTTHQQPVTGQDNWFYANVRNKDGAGPARHFVVTFQSRGYAGTEFLYPDDFFPCIAATAEFELDPGEVRTVKARWPKEQVPPAHTHTCMLASALARSDHPIIGRHVWEHNNLAQKNLTVAEVPAGEFIVIPIVISNRCPWPETLFDIEVRIPKAARGFTASLIHVSKDFFNDNEVKVKKFKTALESGHTFAEPVVLDCGGRIPVSTGKKNGSMMTSLTPDLIRSRFPNAWEAAFTNRGKSVMTLDIRHSSQTVVGLILRVPRSARAGSCHKIDFIQRLKKGGKITGGIAVQITVGSSSQSIPEKERTPHTVSMN